MNALPTRAPTLTDGVVTLRAHRPGRRRCGASCSARTRTCRAGRRSRCRTSARTRSTSSPRRCRLGWQNPSGTKGFAIEALDDGRPRFAGTVDLRPDGQAGVEVGFGLAPWARGRGRDVAGGPPGPGLGLRHAARRCRPLAGGGRQLGLAPGGLGLRLPDRGHGARAARGAGAAPGRLDRLAARGEPMAPGRPWLDAPRIHGRQVVLRPWADADIPRIVEACNDPVSRRWLPELPSPYGRAGGRGVPARASGPCSPTAAAMCWCVADPVDDRCLAALAIFKLGRAEQRGRDRLLGPPGRPRAAAS